MTSASYLRRFFSLILLGLSVGFLTAPTFATERRVERSFSVQAGGTLRLESDRGSVRVRTHDAEEVKVAVELDARAGASEDIFDQFELSFDQRNGDVIIQGKWRDTWSWGNRPLKVHYEIVVPNKYNLDVETAGGSIDVSDLEGQVRLHTSGGSIDLGNIAGAVKASTSGGSIGLRGASGPAELHTSGGSIQVGEVDGPVTARTSGGSVTVDGANGDVVARTSGGSLRLRNIRSNLDAKTSGGSIHAEILEQIEQPAEIRTSGGSIVLVVSPNLKADIDASTSGGKVITDVPITVRGTIGKSSLEGQLNGGGPQITLRTSGGNIEIRARS